MGFIHDRVAASGHEVTDFCSDDAPGYVVGRWARIGFPWAVFHHACTAYRAHRGYDIINVHEPASAVITCLRPFIGNPHVVVTSHGAEHRAWELLCAERRLGREGPSLRSRAIYPSTVLSQARVGLQYSDHVFCLNDDDARFIQRRFRRRPQDITRILPGADLAFAKGAARRDYSSVRSLLFAGTWRKMKGIEDLVPAFVRLAHRFPSVTLTVLGPGTSVERVLSDFPREVRNQVRVVQANGESQTAAEFAAADLFVLPSLFEGTPLVLMEAMMSGLPIVTTKTCGMKDIVVHGQTGILIPLRSPNALFAAVECLLSDHAKRERIGRAAAMVAKEKYNWDSVSARVIDVYKRIGVARSGRPSV